MFLDGKKIFIAIIINNNNIIINQLAEKSWTRNVTHYHMSFCANCFNQFVSKKKWCCPAGTFVLSLCKVVLMFCQLN